MPERFEIICIVYKRRYINTLPFLYYKSTYLLFFLGTNGVGHCCTLLAVYSDNVDFSHAFLHVRSSFNRRNQK